MEKKKRGWLMELFMTGNMVMGAFMSVIDQVVIGRSQSAITRMHEEKKKHDEHEQIQGSANDLGK